MLEIVIRLNHNREKIRTPSQWQINWKGLKLSFLSLTNWNLLHTHKKSWTQGVKGLHMVNQFLVPGNRSLNITDWRHAFFFFFLISDQPRICFISLEFFCDVERDTPHSERGKKCRIWTAIVKFIFQLENKIVKVARNTFCTFTTRKVISICFNQRLFQKLLPICFHYLWPL